MKYLKIQNDGLLAEELLFLMGGTTKRDDEYKIGKFGTGLKYSMSFLLRNNIDIKVFVGEKEISIETKPVVVRDTVFDVVMVNGRDTAITTSMGHDWTYWMIIRELWCNALDEGGAVRGETGDLIGEDGKTTFYIQLVPEIKNVVDNWGNYFLHETECLHETPSFAIYPAGDYLQLFKNGVLIHENKEEKSVFRYDIKNAEINELREYKGYLSYDLGVLVSQLPERLIHKFLADVEGKFEEDLDYMSWRANFGEAWTKALGNAKVIDRETLKEIQKRQVNIDTSHVIAIPKGLFNKLSEKYPSVSAVRTASEVGSFFEIDDPITTRQIIKGLAILESCGYYIDPELKWSVGVFGKGTTLARIDIEGKHIMFSEKLSGQSLFNIVSTIIEENEHYKTGMSDETREFQQHFINLYTRSILTHNNVEL
jgi:hypothetical protein